MEKFDNFDYAIHRHSDEENNNSKSDEIESRWLASEDEKALRENLFSTIDSCLMAVQQMSCAKTGVISRKLVMTADVLPLPED